MAHQLHLLRKLSERRGEKRVKEEENSISLKYDSGYGKRSKKSHKLYPSHVLTGTEIEEVYSTTSPVEAPQLAIYKEDRGVEPGLPRTTPDGDGCGLNHESQVYFSSNRDSRMYFTAFHESRILS